MLSEWLADFLTCWLSYWLIGWLTNWLTGWHVHRLIERHDLLTNILVNWLADWFNYWLAVLLKRIDWQSHTDRLIMIAGSLTNWLGWLADILRFMLRKESRLLIICESRLLIANEDGQFFILDQMSPADVLRLQQPGFWAYLQYCKCCIHCFEI